MPLPNLHPQRHIARIGAAAAFGGLLLCAASSAAALPEGITTADISLWYGGPSHNRSVTGRSFVIVPSQAGAGAIGENGALARVQLVGPTGGTGPGLGLVPGRPGAALVELGIQATLVQGHPLTVSGNPGSDLLAPMWRDLASGSALYHDQRTFGDASLLIGRVVFDGLDYVDPSGFASAGNVQTYFDLDYFDTLHFGAIKAIDALGRALTSFALTNSFGWTLASTPPVEVPGPAAMVLWLLGAAMLFGRRSLPLTLALLGTAVHAQQVGVSGRLTGSLNGVSFDDVEYSQASHTLAQSDGVQAQQNLQDPAVDIDDWAVAGGQSLAHAGFGWLGVQVGAEVDVGVLAGSGAIQASARAQFTDLLTFTPADPALLGTWGRFSYTVVLSGIGGIDDASSNGYGEVIYSGLGLPSGGWISSAQSLGKGVPIGSPLPVVTTFESFTLFGAPTFVEVRLDAELQVLVYEGRVDAYADLMHTAAWGGIASVSTLDGQLLGPDRYALASASGVDYRGAISPVPEPGAWLLLILGTPLLMRYASRSRGRDVRSDDSIPGVERR